MAVELISNLNLVSWNELPAVTKDAGVNKYSSFLWSMLYLTDIQRAAGLSSSISRLNRSGNFELGREKTIMQRPSTLLSAFPGLHIYDTLFSSARVCPQCTWVRLEGRFNRQIKKHGGTYW